jgi:hypothetical protein
VLPKATIARMEIDDPIDKQSSKLKQLPQRMLPMMDMVDPSRATARRLIADPKWTPSSTLMQEPIRTMP